MRLLSLVLIAAFAAGCGKGKSKDGDGATVAPAGDGLGLTDGDTGSAQRQLVTEAIQRSRAAGKPLLIRVTGAWCPPCLAWDTLLQENGAALQETLKGYETLALDEVFYEHALVNDFLPVDIIWYPAYYLFDPAKGRWSIFSLRNEHKEGVDEFKTTLDAFARGDDLAALYQQRSRADIAKKVAVSSYTLDGEAAYYDHYNAMLNTAIAKSLDETATYLDELGAAVEADPALYEGLGWTDVVMQAESLLVARGLEDGQAGWKKMAEELDAAGSTDDQSWEATKVLFNASLIHEQRTAGVKAAAEACPKLVEALVDVKGMTAENKRTKLLGCAQLGVKAGSVTKDAALKLADEAAADEAYVKAEAPFLTLSRLRWTAGDYAGAAALQEKKRDRSVGNHAAQIGKRDAALAADDAKLAKARAESADAATIAELEAVKASDVKYYDKLPALRDREAAAYNELIELLRSGNPHPALARKDKGVGEL